MDVPRKVDENLIRLSSSVEGMTGTLNKALIDENCLKFASTIHSLETMTRAKENENFIEVQGNIIADLAGKIFHLSERCYCLMRPYLN